MKHFLKGLGLTAGAAGLGYVAQHIGSVVDPNIAAIVSPIVAVVAGWLTKSPSE